MEQKKEPEFNIEDVKKEPKFNIEEIRKKVGLPLAIVATLLVWFTAIPKGLSAQGHGALALFAGVFILYLTEPIALPITSLAIVPLAVLMGVVTPAVALGGFSSTSVWLLVGAFVLATAMVKSKLADRLTYIIMSAVGTSITRITLGITVVNILLAFLVPSTTARTAILLPVCLSLIKQFGEEGRSKFAVNILLVLAFTNATISAGILTATAPNPVVVDFVAKAGAGKISYGDWFIYGFPPALIMTAFTWWLIQRMYKPEIKEIPGGKEFVQNELKELGKFTPNEMRALVIFLLVTVLWGTEDITGISPTISCLAAASLLFLPKVGFLNWADANKGISWQVVFVAGGGISLGDILMKTGAAKWIANVMFHAFGLNGLPLVALLIVLMLIIQYLHFIFVGTTAMATAFIPIVIGMAQVAHVNPLILALPAGMIIGGYPLLMFYNTMPNILIYGTGKLTVTDFPKVGFILCTVACILYGLCAVTYWSWLGLL